MLQYNWTSSKDCPEKKAWAFFFTVSTAYFGFEKLLPLKIKYECEKQMTLKEKF